MVKNEKQLLYDLIMMISESRQMTGVDSRLRLQLIDVHCCPLVGSILGSEAIG